MIEEILKFLSGALTATVALAGAYWAYKTQVSKNEVSEKTDFERLKEEIEQNLWKTIKEELERVQGEYQNVVALYNLERRKRKQLEMGIMILITQMKQLGIQPGWEPIWEGEEDDKPVTG